MQFLRAFSFLVLVAVLAACDQTPASKVSRVRRAYLAKEARSVHRDLLAPPEFQLRLSVRRLTCV